MFFTMVVTVARPKNSDRDTRQLLLEAAIAVIDSDS